jgi:type I restriction-modification system DNA methylase subunit
MTDETYHLHQTPAELAKKLIEVLPLKPEDRLYEPFKGEGAFFNNFPSENPKQWAEITQGKDYVAHTDEYDWVITNPPFKLETGTKRVNSFWFLLDYFTDRAKKGVAFLANDRCFCALTPKRMEQLKNKGFCITKIIVSSVKKWRGRYFFIVLEKDKPSVVSHIIGNY